MKAFAIKTPQDHIVLSSVTETEDDCWEEYTESCSFMRVLKEQGYRTVPIEINEIMEGDTVDKEEMKMQMEPPTPIQSTPWEKVDRGSDDGSEYGTYRMKVPGGWLIRDWIYSTEDESHCMAGYPLSDPEHAWNLKETERSSMQLHEMLDLVPKDGTSIICKHDGIKYRLTYDSGEKELLIITIPDDEDCEGS